MIAPLHSLPGGADQTRRGQFIDQHHAAEHTSRNTHPAYIVLRVWWILCTGRRVLSAGRRSLRESFTAKSPAGDTGHNNYAVQASQPGHRRDKNQQTYSDRTDLFR